VARKRMARGAPVDVSRGRPMTLGEMKQQYRMLQEIRQLEAERAAAIERGDPVPGRVRLGLAEALISAEELRTWGNRELTRQIQEVS
jgi:hypothetical protein